MALHFDFVGGSEFSVSTDELEIAFFESFDTPELEVVDEAGFAIAQGVDVDSGFADADTKFVGFANGPHSLGGFEEGFGGHATAQDAKPSQLFGAVDYGDGESKSRGFFCGGVSSAASADDNQIKFVLHA